MKLGPITPEMLQRLDELKKQEDAFFTRHGFPDYSTTDEHGQAHPAYRDWVRVCNGEKKCLHVLDV